MFVIALEVLFEQPQFVAEKGLQVLVLLLDGVVKKVLFLQNDVVSATSVDNLPLAVEGPNAVWGAVHENPTGIDANKVWGEAQCDELVKVAGFLEDYVPVTVVFE